MELFTQKKFLKKKNYLQYSLSNFLRWREKQFENLKIDELNINSKDLSILKKNEFFPHKKTFIYYWLFPFLGFISLTYLSSNQVENFSSIKLFPFLRKENIKTSLAFSTKKEKLMTFVELKDKKLKSYTEKLYKIENNEIYNLWNFYFSKTQEFIFPRFNSNSSLNSLSVSNFSTQTLKECNAKNITFQKNLESSFDFDKSINFIQNNDKKQNFKQNFFDFENFLNNNILRRSTYYWRWYNLSDKSFFYSVSSLKKERNFSENDIFQNAFKIKKIFPNIHLEECYYSSENLLHEKLNFKKNLIQNFSYNIFEKFLCTRNNQKQIIYNPMFANSIKNNILGLKFNNLNISPFSRIEQSETFPLFSYEKAKFLLDDLIKNYSTSLLIEKQEKSKILNMKVNLLFDLKTLEKLKLLEQQILLINTKNFQNNINSSLKVSSIFNNEIKFNLIFLNKLNLLLNLNNLVSSKFIRKTIINSNKIKLKKQKIQFYKKSLKNYKKTIFKIKNFKFFDQLVKKIKFLQYQTFNNSNNFSNFNKLFFQNKNINAYEDKRNINCFSNEINSLKFATYELFLFWKSKKINKNEIILNKKFQNRIKNKDKFLLINNVNYKFSKIKYFSEIFKNINFNSLSNRNTELKFNLIAELNQPLMLANFSQKRNFFSNFCTKANNIYFFNKNSIKDLNFDSNTSSFLFNRLNISLSPYEQNQLVKVPLIFEKKENSSNFTIENSIHTILFKNYFDKILKSTFKYLNEILNVKNLNSKNLNYCFEQYQNFINFKLGFFLKKEQIKLFNQHKLNSSSFSYSINNSLLKAKSSKHSKSYRIKKIKNLVQKISISQKFQNRREEKIFRTYLSSKAKIEKECKDNLSILCTKRFNDFLIRHTIKNLKRNSKKALLINNKKIKNFYFLKNGKETKSHYSFYKQTFKNTNLTNSQKLLFSNLKMKNLIKNESFGLNLFIVPSENLISKVDLSKLNHFRITPKALLRKIGFLFLNEPVFEKNVINKLDSSNQIDKKQSEKISRLEKQKYIQKKRRRKKLKLENRRRKKRKRFFPRPKWLRFNLYSRFLKIRHFKLTKQSKQLLSSKKEILKTLNINNTKKKQVCTQVMFIKQKKNNLVKRKFLSKIISPTFFNYKMLRDNNKLNQKSCTLNFNNEQLKAKIYRQNKQNFNFYGPIQNFDGNKKLRNKFQKIPLVLDLPTFKNNNLFKISNPVMSEFQRLCWKSYWLRSNLTPYIQRIQESFKLIQRTERMGNSKENFYKFFYDLIGLKNDFSKTQKSFDSINRNSNKLIFSLSKRKNLSLLWYLNIKDSLKTTNSLSNFTIFQQTQNISEYNKILSQRISDIIKDVKSNLNGKGQSNAKSIKRGRLREMQKNKLENNFVNNLNKRILPSINVFSPDSLIKPFGEIPMLRIGWALNKTNMLSLNEDIQNKWAYIKRRDQNKSNKTKKLVKQFLKNNFLKIPNQKLDLKIYSSFNLSSDFLNKKEKSQTLNLEKQWIYSDILKNICFKKIILTDQKIQFLGINKENYVSYLQNLKLKFRKIQNSTQKLLLSKNQNFDFQRNQLMLETTNEQNPMKNFIDSIYFWQFSTLSNFINFPNKITPDSYSFVTSPNINSNPQFCEAFSFLSPNVTMSQNLSFSNLTYFTFLLLLALTSLIHFGSLYYLIRIPEIRSLFKFNTLLFLKIWNIYIIVVYSIYDSLKNNKNQLLFLINQIIFKNPSKINHSSLIISNNFNFQHFQSILLRSNIRKSSILNQKFQTNGEFVQLSVRIPFSYSFSIFSNSFNFEECENIKKYKEKKFFFLKNKRAIKSHLESKTEESDSFNLKVGDYLSSVQIIGISKNYEKVFSRILFDLGVYKLILKTQEINKISNKKTISVSKQNEDLTSSVKQVKFFNQFINNLKIKSVKIQSIVYLFILYLIKSSIFFISNSIHFFYSILTSFLDLIESIMLIIYKFLEKPAELMVDWIGQIFLVEWSSDLLTYIPESFDNYNWNSIQKLCRGNRIFGFLGFLIERRLGCFFDLLLHSIQKSDSDVLMRQQKGMIFWDVWSEILIRAAEKYNINIPSLTTLKEEQELLIEKLCEDKDWTWCQSSIYQLTPLMNLIYPQRPFKWFSFEKGLLINNFSSQSFIIPNLNQPKKLQISSSKRKPYFNFSSNLNDIEDYNQNKEKILNKNDIWRAWSVNQYFTSQKVDTDLFVNMHLPKSFNHITTLKYYQPIQPILGSLVCQIYSGLFSKQISKNILVVGAPGSGKSLLIQALAGETELKIIFDNARRYSHVQKGVAVGMKMLRDVFESLSFYTPCLFLIEDIHLIGERRPMLISDDDNSKVMEQSFSLENEEVHEKNQIIYQLSRHSISHYRRPYKGDFSLLIPTNHFCFDLFLGINPSQIRKGGLSTKSPLSVEKIEKQLNYSNENDSQTICLENSDLTKFSTLSSENNKVQNLISQLQFISEKLFAPPATSPFTILVMKEQQKLKVRKLVKEMPWGGLSWDQIMLLPKVTYSIRVKVALLADITISSLSVKLDIITDLLVIMDSVRSNRGFAVFATTHLPYMLDPALRRPGRLDETISLPFLPNFLNRWEIFQTNLINFSLTCDFFDYSTLFSNLNESHILNFISQAKLSLFNSKIAKTSVSSWSSYLLSMNSSNKFLHLLKKEKNGPKIYKNKYSKFPIYSLQQAIKLKINSKFVEPNKIMKRRKVALAKVKNLSKSSFVQQGKYKTESSLLKLLKNFEVYPSIPNTSSNILALAYFQLSKFLINSQFSKISNDSYQNKSSIQLFQNSTKILNFGEATDQSNLIILSKLSNQLNHEESIFLDMYSSPHELKKHLMFLFSGKVGEFFIFNNSLNYSSYKVNFSVSSNQKSNKIYNCWWNSLQQSFHSGLWTLSGIDDFWRSATSLVFSLIQKRFLYQQNLLISKMLYFDNHCILREPPSPPASSILMPAKKYENYQRTFKDFQQKAVYSINEKIQIHQQQRLVKKLYNVPIKEYFNSEIIPNRFTIFVSSFKELGYLNSFLEKPTSFSSYYSRRIWVRQKSSFINQWWNGQLAEHNAETTYLSDVDWRSIFIDSLGDLFIDFPDSDQYYNPRQRRWFLSSSYSSYWTDFEKTIPYEIYSHFMIQAFNETYNFLDSQREILDYFTYLYLKKGILKEIDLISIKARFYSKQKLSIKN